MEHAEHGEHVAHHPEGADGASSDPLLAIRAELDQVDQLPLEQRTEVFERTHRIVTDELRALELG